MKIEKIGNQTLINSDCEIALKTLEKISAIITDPPYGINMDKGFDGSGLAPRRTYDDHWDSYTPEKKVFDLMLNKAKDVFIFGGNYFADKLPVNGHWLVWDKLNTMPTFSDCELVWTNLKKKSVKRFQYEQNGFVGQKEKRVHPTQKPVQVMKWVISQIKEPSVICDPFMGSGSTLVALEQMKIAGIGIEKNEKYFNIACERVFEATLQEDLFYDTNSKKNGQTANR